MGNETSEELCAACKGTGRQPDAAGDRYVTCEFCGGTGTDCPTPPAADASAAALLRAEADRYQREDGTPGDLASEWGWRDTARILREVANRCEGGDAGEDRLETARRAYDRCREALEVEHSERLAAEAERDALKAELTATCDEIEQTLGRALGYPRYADDPKNFPGTAPDDPSVCVGEHVAATIAAEAAERIRSLTASNARLRAACEAAVKRIDEGFYPPDIADQLRAALAEGRGE